MTFRSHTVNLRDNKTADPSFLPLPSLASWYPQLPGHSQLSPFTQRLPEPGPYDLKRGPAKIDYHASYTSQIKARARYIHRLPSLPLTVFIDMPEGRTSRRESMIKAARDYYLQNSINDVDS